MRKLTQVEAEQKSLNAGVKMTGIYMGTLIKASFECPDCGKNFESRPHNVWHETTKSCGCLRIGCNKLSQTEAEQKSLDAGVPMSGVYVNALTKTQFKCPECGKNFESRPNSVWGKLTRSCGCLRGRGPKKITQKEAEQRSIDIGIPMTGVYLGVLTKTQFKCPDCDEQFECTPDNIWRKHTIHCGNHGLFVNGRRSSKPQQLVQQIIDKVINEIEPLARDGFPNHNIVCGSKTINVDIAYIIDYTKSESQGVRIVVEYDEWVYHGHKMKKDKLRLRKLRRNGWKTLQILAHGNIPTESQLLEVMCKLVSTDSNSQTITLEGWGIGPTRFK